MRKFSLEVEKTELEREFEEGKSSDGNAYFHID